MTFLHRRWFGSVMAAALALGASNGWADQPPPASSPDQAAGAAAPAQAPGTAPGAAPASANPAPQPDTGGGASSLYKVVDGDHVDANTMKGWRTWRAMACERCHGATQDGLVGPSLNADLKTMSKDDFKKCVLEGRVEKGMPNFGGSKTVTENIDNLYAYLKGRSDGAIKPGHLKEIE